MNSYGMTDDIDRAYTIMCESTIIGGDGRYAGAYDSPMADYPLTDEVKERLKVVGLGIEDDFFDDLETYSDVYMQMQYGWHHTGEPDNEEYVKALYDMATVLGYGGGKWDTDREKWLKKFGKQ